MFMSLPQWNINIPRIFKFVTVECNYITLTSFLKFNIPTSVKCEINRNIRNIQNYEVYFGLYPSSGIYDKKSQRFGDWICLRPQVDGAR
jgi:hypothetical protein